MWLLSRNFDHISTYSSLISMSLSLKWVGWGWALIWVWLEGGGGARGRLFEAWRLLTFSAFRMGAYSRWALIRGWALIRTNTVGPSEYKPLQKYISPSKRAFEKYKPRDLFSEFYGITLFLYFKGKSSITAQTDNEIYLQASEGSKLPRAFLFLFQQENSSGDFSFSHVAMHLRNALRADVLNTDGA